MNLGPPLEDDVSDNLGNPILREPSNNELRPPMGFRRQLSGLADLPRDESCFSLSDNDELACGHRLNVLMIGTGEYTTGYIEGVANKSDKAAGVVALTMFDMRSRGMVNRLGLCGVNGKKFPGIRKHMRECIQDVYSNINDISISTYPADDVCDPYAYKTALQDFDGGDVAIIFTPDDTHFDIALACIERGLHVLITKPVVMNLEHHRLLAQAAMQQNVLVAVEVHKRWDPIYVDARDRIQQYLGPFSYVYSYMSQPKYQLETFKAWAGKSSDISYYLNSHHIDFHEWCMGEKGRPVSVTAVASTGVAEQILDRPCEDTITLTVQWEMFATESSPSCLGTAIYTSSWIAPKSDVHSQQRFFYMGQRGETTVDQAHRGYNTATDASPCGSSDPVSEAAAGAGLRSVNPLFMKYTPSRNGKFAGQTGYGYRSFEMFIQAVQSIQKGENSPVDFDDDNDETDVSLATIHCTYRTTAILEAGRKSLDNSRCVKILYDENVKNSVQPKSLQIA